jgi:hypothetical protein
MARIIILPTFVGSVYSIGLSVFENPGCITFTSLNEDGEYLGRTAITETFRAGVAVRLYARGINGEDLLIHDFDVDTTGEAGEWATEWCKGM